MISAAREVPRTLVMTGTTYCLPGLLLLIIVLYYLIYRYNGKPVLVCTFTVVILAAIYIIIEELLPTLEIAVRIYFHIVELCKDYQKGKIGVDRFNTKVDKAFFLFCIEVSKIGLLCFLIYYLVGILDKVADDFIFKRR